MGRGRGDRGAAQPNPGMPGKDKILRKTPFFAIFIIFDGISGKDEPQPSPPGRTDAAVINLISARGSEFCLSRGFLVPRASPGATEDDEETTGKGVQAESLTSIVN